jgi:hypothetical protein
VHRSWSSLQQRSKQLQERNSALLSEGCKQQQSKQIQLADVSNAVPQSKMHPQGKVQPCQALP